MNVHCCVVNDSLVAFLWILKREIQTTLYMIDTTYANVASLLDWSLCTLTSILLQTLAML
jgi:hypothetical protein